MIAAARGLRKLQLRGTSTVEMARGVEHDGRIRFFSCDGLGRETERAVFPAAYNTATTRPVLSVADSVTSTVWHPVWNLPRQLAEPGVITSFSYDARGNLIIRIRQSTTDSSGAAKFAAAPVGGVVSERWNYNLSNLVVTTIESVGATQTSNWKYGHDSLGGRVTEENQITGVVRKVLQFLPDGQVMEGVDGRDIRYRFSRGPRGQAIEYHYGVPTAQLVALPGGRTDAADGFVARYSYDASGRLVMSERSNASTITIGYSALGLVTKVSELSSPVAGMFAGSASAATTKSGASGLLICNRGTTILPVQVGNHAYLWDIAARRCCGRAKNKDPRLDCVEKGPPEDACTFVDGSAGKEEEIMHCCQTRANEGPWVPGSNDCHDSAERCVARAGLKYPRAPGGRVGQCPSCWLTPGTGLPPLPPAP